MKRELGIARCGLACCLCSENDHCDGCRDDGCADHAWCHNRRCSQEKGLAGCFACGDVCRNGILSKPKPYAFTLFAKRHGTERLLDCLARNEQNGVVYHRAGIVGDYDLDDPQAILALLETEASDP